MQHQLRECLQQHRIDPETLGSRVPVVAEVQAADQSCFVRLGHQFCVNDAQAAAPALRLLASTCNCAIAQPLDVDADLLKTSKLPGASSQLLENRP